MVGLIVIWQNTTKTTVDTKEIEQHLLEVLRRLKTVGRVEIEISIVNDKEIKKLKQRFFGVNETTDVLSFAYDRPESASHAGAEYLKRSKQTLADFSDRVEGLTGSIAISIDSAARQAESAGIELIDELKTLSSHGILHLLGYHHT